MEQIINLIVLFISMVIQVVIPPLPAELIVISAGKMYGILITTLVAGTGLYLGSILVFFIGKYIHKKFDSFFNQKKVLTLKEKLKRFHSLILWVRVLPYNPSDIISYAAGLFHVETRKFLTISFFTSYIRTLLLAYLGNYITNLSTLLIVLSILLISALIAYSLAFTRLKK